MWRRLFAPLALIAAIGAGAAGFLHWAKQRLGEPGPLAAPVTVIVEKGAGLPEIAAQLERAGAVDSAWLLIAESRLAPGPPLRAGEYALAAGVSMASILDEMRRGQVVEHKFTVAEGLTAKQVAELLGRAEALSGPVPAPIQDGSILPQTYFYTLGETRGALVGRMEKAMSEALDAAWQKRAADLPLADKAQAVTLASIVERETALPDERPHVAAVFENRLRQHMRLQSDPTVTYAASRGEGVLDHPITQKELALIDPYNTYTSDGLPPGPICNPGLASVEAVLHPAASDDLYFVADGTGGHVFAKTRAEHEKNVAKWHQIERDNAAAGKGG